MQDGRRTDDSPDEPQGGHTFSFGFGLGKQPAGWKEDPWFHEAAETEGQAVEPGQSLRENTGAFSLEVKDGVLRVGTGEGAFEYPLTSAELQPQAPDPFPLLTAITTWFRRLVTGLAVLIPVGLFLLGILTGQATDTVFYMTLFGVIVAFMLISSVRPRRTLFGEVVSGLLTDIAHKEMAKRRSTNPDSTGNPPAGPNDAA